MVEVEATTARVRPVSAVGVPASPLRWGVTRRVAWAVAACAALWLAVLWALA
jgi:hypothetical protein